MKADQKKVPFRISLTPEAIEMLTALAKREQRSRSSMVEVLIRANHDRAGNPLPEDHPTPLKGFSRLFDL